MDAFHQHNSEDNINLDNAPGPDNMREAIPLIRPWTRYFARMIDYIIAGFIFGIVEEAFRLDLSVNKYLYASLGGFIWLFVEALLLVKFGTTIGKWLLNTKVKDLSGRNLSYTNALARSFWVWLIGNGACIPVANILAAIYGYNQLTNSGTTLWDNKGKSIVIQEGENIVKSIIAVMIVVVPIVYSASLR